MKLKNAVLNPAIQARCKRLAKPLEVDEIPQNENVDERCDYGEGQDEREAEDVHVAVEWSAEFGHRTASTWYAYAKPPALRIFIGWQSALSEADAGTLV